MDAELRSVPLDQLTLRLYGKDPCPNKLARLEAAFDPAKLDPIIVRAAYDGLLNVVDGQHRTTMLRKMKWSDPVTVALLPYGVRHTEIGIDVTPGVRR